MNKTNQKYTVRYRRKREGKTNYKRRLHLVASGKCRVVIRGSLNNLMIQLVEYSSVGDKVLTSADARELSKLGWKYNAGNISSAYLVGLLLGNKIKKLNVNEVIVDIGLNPLIYGSRLCSSLKGLIDAGINVPHSEDILPSDDRVSGKHIAEYAKKLKQDDIIKYNRQFSGYLKSNVLPEEIDKSFDQIKNNILKM